MDPDNTKSTFEILLDRNIDASKAMLNVGIKTNGKDLTANDLLIIYDLTQFYNEKKLSKSGDNEMQTMSQIIDRGQRQILGHPLVETFIHIKWNLGKWFFLCNFISYALYVISLTVVTLLWSEFHYKCYKECTEGNQTEYIHNQLSLTPTHPIRSQP